MSSFICYNDIIEKFTQGSESSLFLLEVKYVNSENLKANSERTPRERKKLASKAGKASGEARKKKAQIREALQRALNEKYKIDEETLNGYEALAFSMIKEAIGGNVQAFKEIRDTIGEQPTAKFSVSIDDDTIDKMEKFFNSLR